MIFFLQKMMHFYVLSTGSLLQMLCTIPSLSKTWRQHQPMEHWCRRMSKLPDDIRHHILNFLPTIDAVNTTLLSTKWKNLWTTALNNIDLEDGCSPFDCSREYKCNSNRINFAGFVNKLLLLHNAPVIKNFSLTLAYMMFIHG